MPFDYDVIVVGGGPAGSTAARFCAGAGLKTLLIEKEQLPRYKPCGGCLSVKSVRLLGFDLSPVIENSVNGARFTYCFKSPFSIESEEPIAFMVMRDRFDQLLIHKALESGAEKLEGEKVTRAEEKGDGVNVELAEGERIRCEYLIGADGAGSVVAKSFSSFNIKGPGDGIGLECKIPFESTTDFPKEDLHRMHFDFGRVPNGYGWVFPKGKWLSIGVGGVFKRRAGKTPRQHFNDIIKGLDFIRGRRIEKVLGHPVPSFYSGEQKVSLGKVFLVGDAAHLVDPLTGEGIYYALRSGMLAAEAIVQSKKNGGDASAHYQRTVQELLFEDLKSAHNVSQFIYRFTQVAYRTLKHYPELGNFYIQVLEGKETYHGFVTRVKDRARDLLKGSLSGKLKRVLAKPK
jgi:geranylgeranyl reductase family protein